MIRIAMHPHVRARVMNWDESVDMMIAMLKRSMEDNAAPERSRVIARRPAA